ncbi:hypothetical protein BH23BAC1_BH23BAC1_38670 [soil metagenome]
MRKQFVGFVFQNYQLLSTLYALDNVMIPLELRGEKNISKRARMLLERMGLAERIHHYPAQLSGGEQQRFAITGLFSVSPGFYLPMNRPGIWMKKQLIISPVFCLISTRKKVLH